MKLEYRILWFDDQPDNVKSFQEGVARILKENGFYLKVEMRTSISNKGIEELADALRKYNPYDLIIFDHDLGASGHGSIVAQQLRKSIFTDMVYYSGTPVQNLREELFKNAIDGVFIVSRMEFISSIQAIIEDHISKFTDMNNMRGLVLDAFSEIELRLRSRLRNKLENMNPELKNSVLEKFRKKHSDRAKALSKKGAELTTDNLQEQPFDFMNIDFDFIRHRLSKIETECTIWQDEERLARMQELRNTLAHNMYRFEEKNNTVTIAVPNGSTETFDAERFKEIRTDFLAIFDALDAIKCVLPLQSV